MSANTPTAISSYDRDELTQIIEQQQEQIEQQQEQIEQQQEQIEELEERVGQLEEHSGKERAELSSRVATVEQDIESSNPCTQADDTTIQADDLTPIEQLSKADEISKVTESKSVQRAVSIFRNIDNWGSRTPKGIVLKPADNPLSLLEADQDESLAWKQYYRAAECLEQLSEGSVTFFHSDKHGKTICLHEQSEAYQRVVQGRLTSSSVKAGG